MTRPSSRAITMVAGDTLVATTLADGVRTKLGPSPRVAEIASALSERYVQVREGKMESEVLKPRGLSLQSLYGRHTGLNPQLTAVLDERMAKFNLEVELLLVGVDDEGAHIFTVNNPGSPEPRHDVIGYSAIGVGALHALQAMIGFGHSPSDPLRETIYQVYAAKRRAEVAPGVGHDTDVMVVSAAGITELGADQLRMLDTLYSTQETSRSAVLARGLKELTLVIPEAEAEEGNHGHDAGS